MTEEKVYVVGGENQAKEAIAKVFADKGQTAVFVDEGDSMLRKEMASELTKNRPEPIASPIEKIKDLKGCKGRHTYINKGGGLWKCQCGKQLIQ